ncbi:hypothetical protein [Agrobacterium tumefaciens]|uniref:hypothetical protein n=1 Tax=Agrobacterium tumefaciens TaxID=358 RepID=UPI001574EEED|nr:hypothetical protein [Agrobacterium tumefaciens]NTZ90456.1 hypothetical protein [Agrobacterium tumefaciens]
MEPEDFDVLLQRQHERSCALERAKNATTNGRLFAAMVFLLILAVASTGSHPVLWLAVLPLASIGAAYLGDVIGPRWERPLSIAALSFAVLSLLIFLYL